MQNNVIGEIYLKIDEDAGWKVRDIKELEKTFNNMDLDLSAFEREMLIQEQFIYKKEKRHLSIKTKDNKIFRVKFDSKHKAINEFKTAKVGDMVEVLGTSGIRIIT